MPTNHARSRSHAGATNHAGPTNGSPPPEGITVLGTAQREAWLERRLPPVERVHAGVWSVPVPIPHNPLRYTLSYLIASDDGLLVVDPGWDSQEGWQALLAGLSEAGASPGDVHGILATHIHPDHHGLSARLRETSGAWIAMHPAERDTLPQRMTHVVGPHETITDWLRHRGAPADEAAALGGPLDARDPDEAAMADPDVLLEDGDVVPLRGRTLRALWTPGHTPGHLCLQAVEERLLLTGDHVLPRITPNIGLYPGGTGSPLADFLASLERTGEFDDHDALPAHEYRFRGLGERTRLLAEHHERRCRELLDVVADLGTPTPWEVATHLSWSRPWSEIGRMRISALAETESHLDHLVRQGLLTWHGQASGDERASSPDAGGARVRLAATATTGSTS
ncbi:MBL fold metallo-hydrolase [Prauserella rugosa]|uniref:Glyoxylase-like metal-dependent hydrolase (Beta-lactamase superfamily II) n=1 Tax=Prauserella rugosa TaxID=43354 RepID=A0A660CBC1_9PSEU|nr:MBL fold metallo-hydrolase [Prauserella rugosa]KID30219.1 Zn-dependent hydrolase, glyoxylase [Prauserella sp. Am3]TWH19624.1 glyoxylase-like metal-dependent hydrolase (beta-lactamase superfamily II) [Prauserella rugosa]